MQMRKNYKTDENTMAFSSVIHPKFASMIIDIRGFYYSTATPTHLIKEACLTYKSTYEGRRKCVIRYLKFNNKTPIPISPALHIYAFPIISPKQFECVWLFLHHIAYIFEYPMDSTKTIIVFKNGVHLLLDIPVSNIQSQINKTLACSARFSNSDHYSIIYEKPRDNGLYFQAKPNSSTSSKPYVADPKEDYFCGGACEKIWW